MSEFQQHYEVDAVMYADEVATFCKDYVAGEHF
jgi:hypothetical protein